MPSPILQSIETLSRQSSELLDVLYPGFGFQARKPAYAGGQTKLVLFGCGSFSTYVLASLRQRGVVPTCFCDNAEARIGSLVHQLPVLSMADLAGRHPEAHILVTTLTYRDEIDRQLQEAGVPQERIFLPEVPEPLVYEVASQYWSGFLDHGPEWIRDQGTRIEAVHELLSDDESRNLLSLRLALATSCLSPSLLEILAARHTRPAIQQYFDSGLDFGRHGARKDHVFLDAGAYNGDTIEGFLRWSGGRYDRILAFEPEPATMALLAENTARLPRLDRHATVLWSTPGMVPFEIVTARTGSGNVNLDGHHNAAMEAVTIDELVGRDRVSLIKMDIEGAELEALRGGAETIRRCRPMMAVCVYHRPTHLLDIPLFLGELLPGSRMFLRHYASPNPTAESVLYVLPD